eukprot:CAMPEP_0206488914 /NCGR_PEP_ID=MMETSP0324_2-20121206/42769_1 /ASSEMBLY_ACC=CAM_ASM_000836 /TAXON_ID=2866 /ORGANISM="Crypthecodinium cohnii, Strain Seligo" /LENGTH=75 /DNA_ID=CAMNT_0053968175 /DNA_START=141 /DNA_END=365 /DNA_ORIENTATION=+
MFFSSQRVGQVKIGLSAGAVATAKSTKEGRGGVTKDEGGRAEPTLRGDEQEEEKDMGNRKSWGSLFDRGGNNPTV